MSHEIITATPLGPALGAEIEGVDLFQPLGNQAFQEIHDALMEHQVSSVRVPVCLPLKSIT